MNRKYIWLPLILCICVYLAFALFSFHQVSVGDEVIYVAGAQTINTTGDPRDLIGGYYHTFNHPPGYLYAVALVGKFLGVSSESARIVGMLCFVISLLLIYGICRQLFKEARYSYLIAGGACLLYSINSLVIQGSLLLDLDTTTLNAALLLFIFYFVKAPQLLNTKNLIFLGMLFSLALWTKLTTPLGLILSIALFYFLNREYKRGLYYAAIILFLGLSLFLASWWLYCHIMGTPFSLPLLILKARFISMAFQGRPLRNALTVLRAVLKIILWASPFFIALGMLAITERIRLFRQKKVLSKIDFLAIYSLLVFVGYFITGRLNFGFPKYHFPVISTLSILISALFFSKRINLATRIWLVCGLAIALLMIYNVYLIGDLLYSTDYLIKQSLITKSPSLQTVLWEGIVKFLFYLLPLAIYFFGLRLLIPRLSLLRILIISLLIMYIAASLSLNILQARADYLTRYYYGGRKTEQVIDFIKRHLDRSSLILAPPEVVYFSNNSNPSYYYLRDLLGVEEEVFIRAISHKRVDCVVYGICSQMVKHFTDRINKPAVQEALRRSFKASKIGSYWVWLRKN